jgi:hypothetical protein
LSFAATSSVRLSDSHWPLNTMRSSARVTLFAVPPAAGAT